MSSNDPGVLPEDVVKYVSEYQPCTVASIAKGLGTTKYIVKKCIKEAVKDLKEPLHYSTEGYRITRHVTDSDMAKIMKDFGAQLFGVMSAAARFARNTEKQQIEAAKILRLDFSPKERKLLAKSLASMQALISQADVYQEIGD